MAHTLNGTLPPGYDGNDVAVTARERWTLGVISIGHFFSHYFALVLPPLFPFLKAEFGVSYLELGLAMTAYGLLGGVMQSPVGFLVDRVGPRNVLLVGLGLNACAVILMGLVNAYWVLLALAVLAGMGNSVFHPADYAIINNSIREKKLGRAFSLHTFSGFLGGACAPVSILVLAQWTSWRTALIVAGIGGLFALAAMTWRRDLLNDAHPSNASTGASAGASAAASSGASSGADNAAPDGPSPQQSGIRLLLSPAVLLFLLFFILYGMSSGGLIAFTVTGLVGLHGISLEQANTALSAHLFGVVAGILFAGIITDRFPRHLITATAALLLVAIATALAVVVPGSSFVLITLMALSGVGLGAVLPARDLMLRALTPPGQFGKVIGFVFVGYSIGVSIAPILFGWFLDKNQPAYVFYGAAVFALLALMATIAAQRMTPQQ
ncbi:MAG: MFS transporter [Rhodospirillaceae bacterium]|jgi:MFS family permease|nr:MFS transporter [Rhodospirillaceae bacterium]MBT5079671.1 MFS transporter [Rhodospirillaceae bacterium]MBT5527170.1 MFS transporter [Rhodospirillaceae bacterium]MBT5882066.1 MFS transporter [Rhodospirillaceae bacterium]MBT6589889.1 MFS transporter [Rhodospirillaceae bacterium]